MKINLWPTTIAVEKLSKDFCFEVFNNFAIADDKEWNKFLTPEHERELLNVVSSNFGESFKIVEGWMRIVPPNGKNSFDIHSDSHYGGDLIGVICIAGDEAVGGSLTLFDPAWRNPQRISDDVRPNTFNHVEDFEIGKFIIFPANVWHSVSSYYGISNRLTLNLVFKAA